MLRLTVHIYFFHKDICKNELEKRKKQSITDAVAANQPWSLPSSRFNHRFTASG